MTSSARSRSRFEFASWNPDLDRVARPALAVAVLASALLIYHLTRGSSFLADDWTWLTTRRGNSLHAFLAPYNGHLSLVPIVVYRLMFAVFGIGNFAPYRIVLVVIACATGVVAFEYARHRVGEFLALLIATLLLFLGPGWNDILQPFQIAWLLAVGCGILALSLLDRRRRVTDAAACALILISISSTSVGVALAIGIAIDIALARRRWRDAWIVGVPLLLYVVWAVHYHPSVIALSAITSAWLNLAQATATGVAGLVGLSGVTPTDVGGLGLAIGVPLLALALGAIVLRARAGWDWTRFLSLGVALVAFSLMVSLARSFQSPLESRYLYVVCVLVTLMAAELARGLSVPRRVQLALAGLTLVAVVSNIGVLRSGGAYLRASGAATDGTLAAVELDRGSVASDTQLTQLPFYPLVVVTAGQYFATARTLGTPAYSVAQLQHAGASAQRAADAQSLADHDVVFAGLTARSSPTGSAPPLDAAAGASAVRRGACIVFTPAAALAPGRPSTLALRLGAGRLALSAGPGPAAVSVRRFAAAFTALGTVQAGGSAMVSVYRDRAQQPWHLQVQSIAPVRVCTLSGP